MTAAELCSRELLPQQFAYKILKKLERAGLIRISRGMGGGFQLAADLNRVSLYDLLEVFKVDTNVSACMRSGFSCSWKARYGRQCAFHRHLKQIQDHLNRELQSHSISEILSETAD